MLRIGPSFWGEASVGALLVVPKVDRIGDALLIRGVEVLDGENIVHGRLAKARTDAQQTVSFSVARMRRSDREKSSAGGGNEKTVRTN